MTLLATWLFRERAGPTATTYRIRTVARFVVVQVPTDEAVSEALADAISSLPPTMCKEPFLFSVAVVRG